MEIPLFFKNNGYNLFGVLHEPGGTPSPRHPAPCNLGFVFCHPFAEEKLISHRVMVNLARTLTNKGMYCLRFDFMGHGDSDGNFEDATIETRLSDIRNAVDFLKMRTNVNKVGILGVRLGATLAALTNANHTVVDFLILISPIIDGKAYIENCLRSNLTTQMATHKKILKDRTALIHDLMRGEKVNIDGYLLTQPLFQEISDCDLLQTPLTPPPHSLVIQISRQDSNTVDSALQKLVQAFEESGGQAVALTLKEDNFWAETKRYRARSQKIESTIDNWLDTTFK
jgi:exosortase A-associated hydrolase 2